MVELAAVENQRVDVLVGREVMNAEQHDLMVTGSDLTLHRAIKPGSRTLHEDGTIIRGIPGNSGESVASLCGKLSRHQVVILPEKTYSDVAGRL